MGNLMKNTNQKVNSFNRRSSLFIAAVSIIGAALIGLPEVALSMEEGFGGSAETYNGGGGNDYGMEFNSYGGAVGPQEDQVQAEAMLSRAVARFESASRELMARMEQFAESFPENEIDLTNPTGVAKMESALAAEISKNKDLFNALVGYQVSTLDLVDATERAGYSAELNRALNGSMAPGNETGSFPNGQEHDSSVEARIIIIKDVRDNLLRTAVPAAQAKLQDIQLQLQALQQQQLQQLQQLQQQISYSEYQQSMAFRIPMSGPTRTPIPYYLDRQYQVAQRQLLMSQNASLQTVSWQMTVAKLEQQALQLKLEQARQAELLRQSQAQEALRQQLIGQNQAQQAELMKQKLALEATLQQAELLKQQLIEYEAAQKAELIRQQQLEQQRLQQWIADRQIG
jgi:hypothetical protein